MIEFDTKKEKAEQTYTLAGLVLHLNLVVDFCSVHMNALKLFMLFYDR